MKQVIVRTYRADLTYDEKDKCYALGLVVDDASQVSVEDINIVSRETAQATVVIIDELAQPDDADA